MQISNAYLQAETSLISYEHKSYMKFDASKENELFTNLSDDIILSIAEENLKSASVSVGSFQDAVSSLSSTVAGMFSNPASALLAQGNLSEDVVSQNL